MERQEKLVYIFRSFEFFLTGTLRDDNDNSYNIVAPLDCEMPIKTTKTIWLALWRNAKLKKETSAYFETQVQ